MSKGKALLEMSDIFVPHPYLGWLFRILPKFRVTMPISSSEKETKYLNWVQLDEPIVVQIDGTSGDGVILKPIKPEKETMDEEESTGI